MGLSVPILADEPQRAVRAVGIASIVIGHKAVSGIVLYRDTVRKVSLAAPETPGH